MKICGITRPVDAVASADAGADAIGLNFVRTSIRGIDLGTARAVLDVVPDHVMTVGVFRDQLADEVLAVTGGLGLDAAQLHGDPSPDRTAAVAAGGVTVIEVLVAGSPAIAALAHHDTDIVMVDAPVPGGGVPFDWALVGDLVDEHRVLLAGGLGPDNVSAAVRQVRPWGVDVASGVETEPGRKDAAAMRRFVAAARRLG